MKTRILFTFLSIILIITPVFSWWGKGHDILTRAAVTALPTEMPEFFRQGSETITHMVYDPDLFKNRAVPHLNNNEHGEHFFDIELLEDRAWPDRRYEFLQQCAKHSLDPAKVGTLPYALAEWTERLTIALAEYRRWPDNQIIQSKCLIFAGILAHYAQDLAQPLHVTIHFDGRPGPDNTIQGTGIHEKVDGLIERLKLDPTALAANAKIERFTELMPAIRDHIGRSHALLDLVYELEEDLGAKSVPPEVMHFIEERSQAAAGFTASLYLWAWQHSETVKLSSWHTR